MMSVQSKDQTSMKLILEAYQLMPKSGILFSFGGLCGNRVTRPLRPNRREKSNIRVCVGSPLVERAQKLHKRSMLIIILSVDSPLAERARKVLRRNKHRNSIEGVSANNP